VQCLSLDKTPASHEFQLVNQSFYRTVRWFHYLRYGHAPTTVHSELQSWLRLYRKFCRHQVESFRWL